MIMIIIIIHENKETATLEASKLIPTYRMIDGHSRAWTEADPAQSAAASSVKSNGVKRPSSLHHHAHCSVAVVARVSGH